jgi:hypothetical protein
MDDPTSAPAKTDDSTTYKSHAFHLHLPPHHMDDDGVPYITKFAQHKARNLVHLVHSIQLNESLFVADDSTTNEDVEMEEDADLDDDEDEEEDLDDIHALPTEYTMVRDAFLEFETIAVSTNIFSFIVRCSSMPYPRPQS